MHLIRLGVSGFVSCAGTMIAGSLVASVLVAGGCSEAPSDAALPEPDQVYSDVRARVDAVPTSGPLGEPLLLRHEAIPDFVGANGEVYQNRDGTPGMKAMSMPFPEVAPQVSLDGLTPGQPVTFSFAVAWEAGSPRYWVTQISPLPEGTSLDLPSDEPIEPAP